MADLEPGDTIGVGDERRHSPAAARSSGGRRSHFSSVDG